MTLLRVPCAQFFCVLLLSCAALSAWAARPLITDDARVVDDKSCQVESWFRHERSRAEVWALPGCNFTGNLEFTLGGGSFRENGTHSSDLLLQGKYLIKALESNGLGLAVALGTVRHSLPGSGKVAHDVYVNVPVSVSFADDKFTVHANGGWLRDGATGNHVTTWGLASETQLHPRVGLIAEAFGQVSRESFYQLGLRFWVIPDRVQIDTTFGDRLGHGGPARWVSIGLRLLSPAFLP